METEILLLQWFGLGVASLGLLNPAEWKHRKEWDEEFGKGGYWVRKFEEKGWEHTPDPYPLFFRGMYMVQALVCVISGPLGIPATLLTYGYNGFTLRIPL